MSLAMMVVDGWTTLITRRCTEQKFLMRPDRAGAVKNTYEYCVAHAALQYVITWSEMRKRLTCSGSASSIAAACSTASL